MNDNKVIAQSNSGEVRIEAEKVDGKTRFRTYVLNELRPEWNLDDQPELVCNPKGIASYYIVKVRDHLKSVLNDKSIGLNVISELVADMR